MKRIFRQAGRQAGSPTVLQPSRQMVKKSSSRVIYLSVLLLGAFFIPAGRKADNCMPMNVGQIINRLKGNDCDCRFFPVFDPNRKKLIKTEKTRKRKKNFI